MSRDFAFLNLPPTPRTSRAKIINFPFIQLVSVPPLRLRPPHIPCTSKHLNYNYSLSLAHSRRLECAARHFFLFLFSALKEDDAHKGTQQAELLIISFSVLTSSLSSLSHGRALLKRNKVRMINYLSCTQDEGNKLDGSGGRQNVFHCEDNKVSSFPSLEIGVKRLQAEKFFSVVKKEFFLVCTELRRSVALTSFKRRKQQHLAFYREGKFSGSKCCRQQLRMYH